ncbi:hypothetical protein E5P55_01260 [Candidatus Pinguicoccus supinus]|uniref:Uncharacterized protein n=1 Tax=Candidatus Pinguicoccus supinus TaxID=2529394 RepID=A0A7T0FYD7_9BACT|nr:hypothetical protein E5P55_01260 [Candidatus Pinguicoccus supinus]
MSSREIFKRVVVTGIGFITSLDNSKLKVIYNLKNLKHNFILSSEFARVVGDIKNFDLKSQQVLD